jgi:hypothetical protein
VLSAQFGRDSTYADATELPERTPNRKSIFHPTGVKAIGAALARAELAETVAKCRYARSSAVYWRA